MKKKQKKKPPRAPNAPKNKGKLHKCHRTMRGQATAFDVTNKRNWSKTHKANVLCDRIQCAQAKSAKSEPQQKQTSIFIIVHEICSNSKSHEKHIHSPEITRSSLALKAQQRRRQTV